MANLVPTAIGGARLGGGSLEVGESIRRRRMVRSFEARDVPPDVVDALVLDALRSPTAGNARGVAWLVLQGPEETARYWYLTTTEAWRAASRRWAGLARAPVVALSLASPEVYVDRYGEPDKEPSGLGPPPAGGGEAAWPVPYWFGDAAFSTMALLLGAESAGLGACFLGNFRGEAALLAALGVPPGWRLFGAVLLGHPDGADHRSPSLDRVRPGGAQRLHRGRWRGP